MVDGETKKEQSFFRYLFLFGIPFSAKNGHFLQDIGNKKKNMR
jgi:hypothetical protein